MPKIIISVAPDNKKRQCGNRITASGKIVPLIVYETGWFLLRMQYGIHPHSMRIRANSVAEATVRVFQEIEALRQRIIKIRTNRRLAFSKARIARKLALEQASLPQPIISPFFSTAFQV